MQRGMRAGGCANGPGGLDAASADAQPFRISPAPPLAFPAASITASPEMIAVRIWPARSERNPGEWGIRIELL